MPVANTYELADYAGADEDRERLLDESAVDHEQIRAVVRAKHRRVPVKTIQTNGSDSRWWMLLVLLGLIFVILKIAGHILKPQFKTLSQTSNSTRTWSRPTEDYVLASGWNFDAPPQLRDFVWTIEDASVNPDGVYRPMMLINGQYPGPLIRANEGDTIRVTVKNKAVNATAFHWHGLYQNGTNHMDGTVGVTQCPVASGRSFAYEFKLQNQSGTYWYHGHHGVQASDGLYGPFIIHARNEKELRVLDYDTDRVIMVSDHYHDVSTLLTQQYLAPDRENAEPVPDSALINGKAVRDCSQLPHRSCNNATADVENPEFIVASDARHRLRIINTGAFAEFQIQIDEHELAVIEVDGTDVVPVSYHRLNINAAQRYSVVVHTNITTSDAFWMRARMIPHCFTDIHPFLQTDVNAVVRYERVDNFTRLSSSIPTSKDWGEALELQCRDLNTTELAPVQPIAAPEADAFFYIRSNFEIGDWRLSRGFFNSSSFRPLHHSSTLYRTLTGLATHNASFLDPTHPASFIDHGTAFVNDRAFYTARDLVIQSTGIQVIDILIHNFDDGNHPMHLHGHKFFVLASGRGAPPTLDKFRPPSDRANVQPLYDSLDLRNPLRRDTASVEAYGWLLIRFVADNPGVWALHCHVAWHAEAGLLMQFLTRTDVLAGLEVPKAQMALCDAPGVERGRAWSDEEYITEAKKEHISV